MSDRAEKLTHLGWAIDSRTKNQKSSLRLLILFENYEAFWKTKKFSRAAQDLVAVAFSLWRAAFLAQKKSTRSLVFDAGRNFLEKFTEDNAIGFPQDKTSNEWTFNYYTRNARQSLEMLAEYWPDVVPKYEGRKRKPTERWDYCQGVLDDSIVNFEKLLAGMKADRDRQQQAAKTRTERKIRRKKVRTMTLQSRP